MDRLGTRVEFTENENLSKKSAGPRQRNLVTVDVFEKREQGTKPFACSPAWSSDNRWSEMSSRDIDKANTLAKMQVTVGF